MPTDIDCIVIGAGVVGLAIARELCPAGREVLVIEQHDRTGAETSSRNSEVIHAGLYYPPGSFKARACVEGKALLHRFAADNGVPARRIGKLLVATSPAEVAKLEAIAANARASGVDDLVALTANEARAMEPALACVAAYLSPSTGIIDSHALMTALEGHIQAAGGTLALATRVTGLRGMHAAGGGDGFAVETEDGDGARSELTCRALVIAAGLHASRLARMLFPGSGAGKAGELAGRDYRPPATHYAKGHYFTLTGRAPFAHLVYPMPAAGGLGVHLTLDMAGAAKFGPDVQWVEEMSYTFDDVDGARRAMFQREIRRWWPDLPDDALAQGYTGIRPKLSRPGEPAADFAIHGPATHGLPGLVALYGIESPGLTAALAIAREVASRISRQ